MNITYKAACVLLENKYAVRDLNQHIKEDMPEHVLKTSQLVAHTIEDFKYLGVIVEKRDYYSDEYTFFVGSGEVPLTIIKNRDLNLVELAALYIKSNIEIELFHQVIESISDNLNIDYTPFIQKFNKCVELLKQPVKIDGESESDMVDKG